MPNSLKSLLPCPFCGGGAETILLRNSEAWIASCANVNCPVDAITPMESSQAEAITAWNTRAPIAEGGDSKEERAHMLTIGQRDYAHEVIDDLLDMVLGIDRPEWSSAYDFTDAVNDVAEHIESLSRQGGEDLPPAAVLNAEWNSWIVPKRHGFTVLCEQSATVWNECRDKFIEAIANRDGATRASEAGDCLELLKRIRDDKSWRTNDNALWGDILKAIAAAPAPGGGRGD